MLLSQPDKGTPWVYIPTVPLSWQERILQINMMSADGSMPATADHNKSHSRYNT